MVLVYGFVAETGVVGDGAGEGVVGVSPFLGDFSPLFAGLRVG